jgi:hypothetical protein
MSYGIKTITNTNGQVLISPDTKNLHFTGSKLTPDSVLRAPSQGSFSGLYKYRWIGTGTPTPLFYLAKPDSFGAITRITNVSGTIWEIEAIAGGYQYMDPPMLYIFVEPKYISTSERYGILVPNSDNSTVSFDSRKRPLVISATATISHSAKPCNTPRWSPNSDFCASGFTAAEVILSPDSAITYNVTGILPKKPLFLYYSIAQAHQEITVSRTDTKDEWYRTSTHYYQSWYWAFYRGVVGAKNGTVSPPAVFADWAVASCWCYHIDNDRTSTFGIFKDNSANAAGAWPYTNKTINPQQIVVSIAPGEFYD